MRPHPGIRVYVSVVTHPASTCLRKVPVYGGDLGCVPSYFSWQPALAAHPLTVVAAAAAAAVVVVVGKCVSRSTMCPRSRHLWQSSVDCGGCCCCCCCCCCCLWSNVRAAAVAGVVPISRYPRYPGCLRFSRRCAAVLLRCLQCRDVASRVRLSCLLLCAPVCECFVICVSPTRRCVRERERDSQTEGD